MTRFFFLNKTESYSNDFVIAVVWTTLFTFPILKN